MLYNPLTQNNDEPVMKAFNALLTILLLLLASNVAAHGGDDHKHQTREQITWEKLSESAMLIDVRTPTEYVEQHLKDAMNIPYKNIVQQLQNLTVPKDQSIVLYCRSGNRAGKALISLRKAGYTNIHNGGGINALLEAKP